MTKHKQLYRGLASVSLAAALSISVTSCSLDRDPPLNQLTSEQVYKDPANYRQILAKLYAGLNLTGQNATGSPDIVGGDEGATSYSRLLWKMQELGADHAVVAWGDGAIQDLNTNSWTSANDLIQNMYTRIFYEISLCNEYLRQTTDGKLSDYGISGADAERARSYRNDARFLRALAYSHALDLYGNVPFVTENDPIGYFFPKQLDSDFATGRRKLFEYIETELKAIETPLGTAEYGRAGTSAAQTLLAHLYLNAEVYTGTARWNDAATYAAKVIDSPNYGLSKTKTSKMTAYAQLFAADNGENAEARKEMIFAITADGLRSQSYGGSTFFVHASVGAQFRDALKGVKNAWGGIRSKPQLPLLWGDSTAHVTGSIADERARFFTIGQSFQMRKPAEITDFRFGFAVPKWTNLKSDSTAGSDPTGTFVDTDIPFFRLGELYLTYAEAAVRGGGDVGRALTLVNELRQRAQAPAIAAGDLTLDFLLAERGRELYWESYRRTDLIRFGKFTGSSYLWNYKNNVKEGAALPDYFSTYPIPSGDLAANPSLVQRPGY